MGDAAESDLFEQLDSLANAEPLSAEDDLILRMQAVSKVRGRKGAKLGEPSKPKTPGPEKRPKKSIKKKRRSTRKSMQD